MLVDILTQSRLRSETHISPIVHVHYLRNYIFLPILTMGKKSHVLVSGSVDLSVPRKNNDATHGGSRHNNPSEYTCSVHTGVCVCVCHEKQFSSSRKTVVFYRKKQTNPSWFMAVFRLRRACMYRVI